MEAKQNHQLLRIWNNLSLRWKLTSILVLSAVLPSVIIIETFLKLSAQTLRITYKKDLSTVSER